MSLPTGRFVGEIRIFHFGMKDRVSYPDRLFTRDGYQMFQWDGEKWNYLSHEYISTKEAEAIINGDK